MYKTCLALNYKWQMAAGKHGVQLVFNKIGKILLLLYVVHQINYNGIDLDIYFIEFWVWQHCFQTAICMKHLLSLL